MEFILRNEVLLSYKRVGAPVVVEFLVGLALVHPMVESAVEKCLGRMDAQETTSWVLGQYLNTHCHPPLQLPSSSRGV